VIVFVSQQMVSFGLTRLKSDCWKANCGKPCRGRLSCSEQLLNDVNVKLSYSTSVW